MRVAHSEDSAGEVEDSDEVQRMKPPEGAGQTLAVPEPFYMFVNQECPKSERKAMYKILRRDVTG